MGNTGKALGNIPIKFIFSGAVFLFTFLLFAFLAHFVVIGQQDLFDSHVFSFFESHTTPFLLDIMKVITFFGDSDFLLPAYIIVILLLFFRKERRMAIDIGIVGLSSDLFKLALKNGFRRRRPDLPLIETLDSYSFPSGHAFSSFIFFSMIVYIIWKSEWPLALKWSIAVLLALFSLAIGVSRVVLRFHYASDVLAGFCIGVPWVMFSLWSLNKIHQRLEKKKASPPAAERLSGKE